MDHPHGGCSKPGHVLRGRLEERDGVGTRQLDSRVERRAPRFSAKPGMSLTISRLKAASPQSQATAASAALPPASRSSCESTATPGGTPSTMHNARPSSSQRIGIEIRALHRYAHVSRRHFRARPRVSVCNGVLRYCRKYVRTRTVPDACVCVQWLYLNPGQDTRARNNTNPAQSPNGPASHALHAPLAELHCVEALVFGTSACVYRVPVPCLLAPWHESSVAASCAVLVLISRLQPSMHLLPSRNSPAPFHRCLSLSSECNDYVGIPEPSPRGRR